MAACLSCRRSTQIVPGMLRLLRLLESSVSLWGLCVSSFSQTDPPTASFSHQMSEWLLFRECHTTAQLSKKTKFVWYQALDAAKDVEIYCACLALGRAFSMVALTISSVLSSLALDTAA
jgi:hypothetical protein